MLHTTKAEKRALSRSIRDEARQQLLRGLIAALPAAGWWTAEEREHWLSLCHFLIDWLIETE